MTGWRSPLAAALVLLGLGVPGGAAAAEGDGEPLFAFADREIAESSGLVDAGDVVHTVNDSGSGPVLYTVDVSTGATTGRTTYTDGEVVDVEALAPGRDRTVWVGDIGDNAASRDSVSLYRVRPGQGGAARLDLTYPDGPRDAEALLAHPRTGRLFVVSKTVFGGTVYAVPAGAAPGETTTLREFARVTGLVTDGAFLPDGRHVVLRSYGTATVYSFPGFEPRGTVALPEQRQGEAIVGRRRRPGAAQQRGRRGRGAAGRAAAPPHLRAGARGVGARSLARRVVLGHLAPGHVGRGRRRATRTQRPLRPPGGVRAAGGRRPGAARHARLRPAPHLAWAPRLTLAWRRHPRGKPRHGSTAHGVTQQPRLVPPPLRQGLRLPRRQRRPADRRARRADQGPGHPAGLAGRLDLPAAQRPHPGRRASTTPDDGSTSTTRTGGSSATR